VAVAIRILVCAAAARVRVNLLAHLRFVAHPGRPFRAALSQPAWVEYFLVLCHLPLAFWVMTDFAPAGEPKLGQDQTKKRRGEDGTSPIS
jgi:hypothetical protein